MTEDLMVWLRQQIADRRARAEAASKGPWSRADDRMRSCEVRGPHHTIADVLWHDDAEHVVANDPREILAQCDAHAAVLDKVSAALRQPDSAWDVGYAVLHALALAYRHRPGYREEWGL